MMGIEEEMCVCVCGTLTATAALVLMMNIREGLEGFPSSLVKFTRNLMGITLELFGNPSTAKN